MNLPPQFCLIKIWLICTALCICHPPPPPPPPTTATKLTQNYCLPEEKTHPNYCLPEENNNKKLLFTRRTPPQNYCLPEENPHKTTVYQKKKHTQTTVYQKKTTTKNYHLPEEPPHKTIVYQKKTPTKLLFTRRTPPPPPTKLLFTRRKKPNVLRDVQVKQSPFTFLTTKTANSQASFIKKFFFFYFPVKLKMIKSQQTWSESAKPNCGQHYTQL